MERSCWQTRGIQSFYRAAGIEPNTSALAKIDKAAFPFDKGSITASLQLNNIQLRFPLRRRTALWIWIKFSDSPSTWRIMELHVDHYGGKDDGRTHAPVPFYVSDRGYGVFINSADILKCGLEQEYARIVRRQRNLAIGIPIMIGHPDLILMQSKSWFLHRCRDLYFCRTICLRCCTEI